MSSASSGDEDASFYDAPAGSESESETDEAMASVDWLKRDASEPQFNSSPTTPAANATAVSRTEKAVGAELKQQYRYSLPEPVPAVPAIPEHHLATGKRATLLKRRTTDDARQDLSKPLNVASSPIIHVQRPSISGAESVTTSPPRSATSRTSHHNNNSDIAGNRTPSPANHTRRKSLPALPARSHKETLERLENSARRGTEVNMNRLRKGRNEDLFLELANDQDGGEDSVRPLSRSGRPSSRMSFSGKRRSLPSQVVPSSTADLRPKTSGGIFGNRPSSRLDNQPSDLQRHVDRYRATPSRAAFQSDDAVSVSARSRSGRPLRYPTVPGHTTSLSQRAESIGPQDHSQYGRQRQSFGAASQAQKTRPSQLPAKQHDTYSASPTGSSDPKQPNEDSASAESGAQDTVWDELDDLKSRIKKLELTGKLPPTSGAAVSNETSERPRTATTAPTTIDSSPKHEKQDKKPDPEAEPDETPASNAVGSTAVTNSHPLLHAALAKAKPLLSPALYRSLEATAADALQLAALTGSSGPQGTAYSAAAIINGVTVADRHVRRKADTMCRNLTDLCLALCEGKHEAASIVSSPVTLHTPVKSSPTTRFPRNSLDPNDGLSRNSNRPMSRLEARRVSILGSQAGSSLGNSPAASGGEDLSASEPEGTPSNLRVEAPRRFSRAGSRLQASRLQRYGEASGEDDDPTVRPTSRAVTDLGRAKPSGPRGYSTPQRSPSLRDSLVARQANSAGYEGNREMSRVASLSSESGSRRRFHDPSTPPVLEEEGTPDGYQPISQPKRRVMSFNQYPSRRKGAEAPSRATSLNQRRHIVLD